MASVQRFGEGSTTVFHGKFGSQTLQSNKETTATAKHYGFERRSLLVWKGSLGGDTWTWDAAANSHSKSQFAVLF